MVSKKYSHGSYVHAKSIGENKMLVWVTSELNGGLMKGTPEVFTFSPELDKAVWSDHKGMEIKPGHKHLRPEFRFICLTELHGLLVGYNQWERQEIVN